MFENKYSLTDDELINYWRYRAARAESWNQTVAMILFDCKDDPGMSEHSRKNLNYAYKEYCNPIQAELENRHD